METSSNLKYEELSKVNESATENNRNSCRKYVSQKVLDVLNDEELAEEIFSESFSY